MHANFNSAIEAAAHAPLSSTATFSSPALAPSRPPALRLLLSPAATMAAPTHLDVLTFNTWGLYLVSKRREERMR